MIETCDFVTLKIIAKSPHSWQKMPLFMVTYALVFIYCSYLVRTLTDWKMIWCNWEFLYLFIQVRLNWIACWMQCSQCICRMCLNSWYIKQWYFYKPVIFYQNHPYKPFNWTVKSILSQPTESACHENLLDIVICKTSSFYASVCIYISRMLKIYSAMYKKTLLLDVWIYVPANDRHSCS